MWPALSLCLTGALIGLHLWWRRKSRRTEAALRERLNVLEAQQAEALSQERLQAETLFDSMVEGCLLLDAGGRIQITNRAFRQLFGVSGDCRGQTVIEVLRLHELAGLVNRLETEERVLDFELRVVAPTERFIQVNAAAIRGPAGKRRGALLVFHDLTRQKRLEQTSSEFVANVSHELRTPLSMIKGYAETLLGGARDDPELATKFLHTIERHANRLALLIEDLLTSSELESGRAVMNLKPVALRPLVDKVFEDFEARARAREVQLLNRLPPLTVKADADRLQQVFANLVDNAIKYGRVGGTTIITAHEREPWQVEIQVRDDGPGLPPEAVERIFERFYRVDKARSRDQGGTGLGLSIVKDIVQAHGGKVWAQSQPGQGTTFCFTLPAAAGAAAE